MGFISGGLAGMKSEAKAVCAASKMRPIENRDFTRVGLGREREEARRNGKNDGRISKNGKGRAKERRCRGAFY